ncbi:unnamed protein product [Arctia plantaginis]|uniref:F-box domain-containing protein n=1 Tax=Arctia plantaginis TaxID=874455 RepID=A0A8S0ZGU4_ARCPL|nr:unnamed protein product [Arctia plantaginis]
MSLASESDSDYVDESEWQNETRLCGVVLREVFPWLSGADLARAGATCRAWRRAACDPPLWRQLLLRDGYLPNLLQKPPPDMETVSWREEYVTACAGWKLEKQHVVAAGGVSLLHAALAPSHDTLALSTDDASLIVWRCEHGEWCELWRSELRSRGWASLARVLWARIGNRLLLTGPRVLIDDWELMVLQLDEDYRGGCVLSRVRCSAGAAGCWADAGDTFLSLELRVLAPGIACTTVWLNAATQETQSEYAGVRSPLLRIFNEGGAHITHALVANTEPDGRRTLITGSARGLGAWPVVEPRPQPLLAGAPGELAERVQRRRARRGSPEEPAPAPDEASVRAACAPPDRECPLAAPLIGLVLHDSGRWVCAVCSDGSVTFVCTRTLAILRECRAPAAGAGPAAAAAFGPQHYVQPAVSAYYAASPAGGYSPRVWTWSLRSGARQCVGCAGGGAGGAGGGAGQRGAAVCALLPRAPAARAALLTLAADTLYVWRSRATLQSPPGGDSCCSTEPGP